MENRNEVRYRHGDKTCRTRLLLVALAAISGCGSAAPLSITMEHPETRQTLTCAAKDQLGRSDQAMLANTVENCARNLEARGFVRKK